MRSHWGHIKRCFSVSVVKLHRRVSATNGIPRLVSILVVHIVKAVVSPGAVNRCLPLPLFEMLVERALNIDAGLDTINACKVRNNRRIFLKCESNFPLSFIFPIQVQPNNTMSQDYEQVPRIYDFEDKFQILWFLKVISVKWFFKVVHHVARFFTI